MVEVDEVNANNDNGSVAEKLLAMESENLKYAASEEAKEEAGTSAGYSVRRGSFKLDKMTAVPLDEKDAGVDKKTMLGKEAE